MPLALFHAIRIVRALLSNYDEDVRIVFRVVSEVNNKERQLSQGTHKARAVRRGVMAIEDVALPGRKNRDAKTAKRAKLQSFG